MGKAEVEQVITEKSSLGERNQDWPGHWSINEDTRDRSKMRILKNRNKERHSF